jgi:hypothetical protein
MILLGAKTIDDLDPTYIECVPRWPTNLTARKCGS